MFNPKVNGRTAGPSPSWKIGVMAYEQNAVNEPIPTRPITDNLCLLKKRLVASFAV